MALRVKALAAAKPADLRSSSGTHGGNREAAPGVKSSPDFQIRYPGAHTHPPKVNREMLNNKNVLAFWAVTVGWSSFALCLVCTYE